MKNVYVRLLNEGVEVFRPVPAKIVAPGVYVLEQPTSYDPEDECWEFKPGSRVVVEDRMLEGEMALVAARLHEPTK